MSSDDPRPSTGFAPTTEGVDPALLDLDTWPADRVVTTVLAAQKAAAAVAADAGPALAAAVAGAVARLQGGAGRLIYAGAGTSGRLAVQDGAELLPTYGWPADRLITLMAGGEPALTRSVEGAEDDGDAAARAVTAAEPHAEDVLIAVAASGRTPFVCSALRTAAAAGALTIAIANNRGGPLTQAADHPIVLETGPEVVAGSTRMAAGTAQKIALTTLSTGIMVGLGRTFGPFMIHLAARNEKLDARRIDIVAAIAAVPAEAAASALAAAEGRVAEACLIALGLEPGDARDRMARHRGPFRQLFYSIQASR